MANSITINARASKAVRDSLRDFVRIHLRGKEIVEKESKSERLFLDMVPPVVVKTGSEEAGWIRWDVSKRILEKHERSAVSTKGVTFSTRWRLE